MKNRKKVLVYRKRLLPYSETFIADQGRFLPTYQAAFAGLHEQQSGKALLDGEKRFLLDELSHNPKLSKLLMRLGFRPDGMWRAAIEQYSPSLIHAHFLNDGLDAMSLKKNLGIPLVTTLHGHDITKPESVFSIGSQSKKLFNCADKIIAVSNFIAGHAIHKGCPENRLVQHYIGIDLQKFQQQKQESSEPGLLFVGRLTEKKGVTYLLQAMRELKKKIPELYLTIVGTGAEEQKLRAEADSYQLDVRFVGQKTPKQIRELLSTHWLFTAPSITAENGDAEGLGMVFLEAQAIKTPVVSFKSGGVVEAVADQQTGLLCDEKDVSSLSDNIFSLLQSDGLRQRMGEAGRERVEQDFDIRKQCGKLETIYDSVIN